MREVFRINLPPCPDEADVTRAIGALKEKMIADFGNQKICFEFSEEVSLPTVTTRRKLKPQKEYRLAVFTKGNCFFYSHRLSPRHGRSLPYEALRNLTALSITKESEDLKSAYLTAKGKAIAKTFHPNLWENLYIDLMYREDFFEKKLYGKTSRIDIRSKFNKGQLQLIEEHINNKKPFQVERFNSKGGVTRVCGKVCDDGQYCAWYSYNDYSGKDYTAVLISPKYAMFGEWD